MESTVLIILLLLLLVGWLFIRQRGQQPTKAAKSERRRAIVSKSSEFHAVTLKFPLGACAAAKDLEGERFLAKEAPKIPLPECNSINCQCRFVHHRDRRTGRDRRNVFTTSGYSSGTGKFEQERREGDDRRHEDDEEFF